MRHTFLVLLVGVSSVAKKNVRDEISVKFSAQLSELMIKKMVLLTLAASMLAQLEQFIAAAPFFETVASLLGMAGNAN